MPPSTRMCPPRVPLTQQAVALVRLVDAESHGGPLRKVHASGFEHAAGGVDLAEAGVVLPREVLAEQGRAERWMMPFICAAVRSGRVASINATIPHTNGLAMLVPVMPTQGRAGLEKPLAATMSRARRGDVGFAAARRASGPGCW